MSRVLLALVLIGLGGCAHQHRHRSTGGPLAEAFGFEERDRKGGAHPFARGNGPGERHIPDPGLVDVDSLIQIRIDRKLLGSSRASLLDPVEARRMQALHERLRRAIEAYNGAAEVRASYADEYTQLLLLRDQLGVAPDKLQAAVRADPQSPLALAFQKFRRTRDQLDRVEFEVAELSRDLYRDDAAFSAELDGIAEEDPGIESLSRALEGRLQTELAQANRAQEVWLEPIASAKPGLELEIEAWLDSGEERSQIHLPGYDDLGAGRVQSQNRSALDLSPEDLAELARQWDSTVRLAAALEAYRVDRSKLGPALESAAELLAPQVRALLEELRALVAEIRAADVPALLAGARAELEQLVQQARAAVPQIGDDVAGRLATIVEGRALVLSTAERIASFAGEVRPFLDLAGEVRPEGLIALVAQIRPLYLKGQALLGELQELARTDVELLRKLLEDELASLETALGSIAEEAPRDERRAQLAAARELFPSSDLAPLKDSLAPLQALAGRGLRVAEAAQAVFELIEPLQSVSGDSLVMDPGPARTRRVAYDQIKSTSIDLTRTQRSPGDRVELRARLYRTEGEGPDAKAEVLDELEGSFSIREFGWHDRLSPSVVLVRPVELEDGDETFSFAPVLSWVHSYGPRPEERGFGAGLQRFLDSSIGIHASFLNFDPDKEVEIGLGATFSFWRERLQVGGGVNLMGSGSDDGRFYYFVGSDLISVLDSIGAGD